MYIVNCTHRYYNIYDCTQYNSIFNINQGIFKISDGFSPLYNDNV